MPPYRRALLIGSAYNGLKGPPNDIRDMKDALENKGFSAISTCSGLEATRAGILEQFRKLIEQTSSSDAVVVYYSGHGGLVQPEQGQGNVGIQPQLRQFIVPMDYEGVDMGFNGILDIELSRIFKQITDITHNLTIILDCCHSGRMARNPIFGKRAAPRYVPGIRPRDLDSFYQRNQLSDHTLAAGNPYSVRIVAAAQDETAWEYPDENDAWHGAMTQALVQALSDAVDSTTWKTSLMQVRETLQGTGKRQHAQVEGPAKRMHFALEEDEPGYFPATLEHDGVKIAAGKVIGLAKRDIVTILPHGQQSLEQFIAKAMIAGVDAFTATGVYTANRTDGTITSGVAVLTTRSLRPYLMRLISDYPQLVLDIQRSRFVRAVTGDEPANLGGLLRIEDDGSWLRLYDEKNTEISSQLRANHKVIVHAMEQIARARLFQDLRPEPQQQLAHGLSVEFATVENNRKLRDISIDGTTSIFAGDKAFIRLHNLGESSVYVNIFNVNVCGKITLLNYLSWETGIKIDSGGLHLHPEVNNNNLLRGESFSWPEGLPAYESINESIIFIISDKPVDLRYLDSPNDFARGFDPNSDLQSLTYQIALGGDRDFGSRSRARVNNPFDVVEIPFLMHPKPYSADQLRDPQATEDWERLSREWPDVAEANEKGLIGKISRTARGIPPFIWIVNKHTENIEVVVSKCRPSRLWTDFSINASATGAGVSFSTEKYALPAARKTLQPYADGQKLAIGTFPLWDRAHGSAVVSIFVGAEKRPFIENDFVPIGATATFTNAPDLEIVKYENRADN